MRFAVTAITAGVLGLAAALLVACGNSNGLLPGDEAGSLKSALAQVERACANGRLEAAEAAARTFRAEVGSLSPPEVDRRLIANLERGATTLAELVGETCTAATETIPTETVPPPVTTTPPATTPVEPPQTQPTTPAPPDTPPATTPVEPPAQPTTPPDGGGDERPTPPGGGASPSPGGSSPGGPPGNPGNDNGVGPGGASPGQGGQP